MREKKEKKKLYSSEDEHRSRSLSTRWRRIVNRGEGGKNRESISGKVFAGENDGGQIYGWSFPRRVANPVTVLRERERERRRESLFGAT